MSDPPRPLPTLNQENRFFWTSGADGMLRFLRCGACGLFVHPYGPICPSCHNRDLQPAPVSGLGRIASFTLNHQSWDPRVATPYVIAIVQLDEQEALCLTTNIVNTPAEKVAIGQRVRVVFEQQDEVWYPLFEPA